MAATVDTTLLYEMRTNQGQIVGDLSGEQPVLLIFLRHFGCTFCREALGDIAARRSEIEARGSQLVLVHMSPEEVAVRYLNRYDLGGIAHVSDPDCRYYTGFGLTKGSFTQLFGLQVWARGFQSAVLEGHGVGIQQIGDGFQMPGIFVVQDGEITEAFIHRLASSRPDYLALLHDCCPVL